MDNCNGALIQRSEVNSRVELGHVSLVGAMGSWFNTLKMMNSGMLENSILLLMEYSRLLFFKLRQLTAT